MEFFLPNKARGKGRQGNAVVDREAGPSWQPATLGERVLVQLGAESSADCLLAFVNRKQTKPILLGLEEKLAPCVTGFCHSWKD